MSAATRLRRLDEGADIVVLERSGHVSYANCGLPYCVGGVIEDEADLPIQTTASLHARFRLDVRVDTEVVAVDASRHEVSFVSTRDGTTGTLRYDKLVLSPGVLPVRPAIPASSEFGSSAPWRTPRASPATSGSSPDTAVVIGAGFIGLETAENLSYRGIAVSVVEALDQILAPLDPEMAVLVAAELEANGVRVVTGAAVAEVVDGGVRLEDGRTLPGQPVVGSVGIRPDIPPGGARVAVSRSMSGTGRATRTSTPSVTPSRNRTGSVAARC
jgi:NADPH-dependent 2,4-dienoyl-CoA reductase/sulfur reductase-like enzyme